VLALLLADPGTGAGVEPNAVPAAAAPVAPAADPAALTTVEAPVAASATTPERVAPPQAGTPQPTAPVPTPAITLPPITTVDDNNDEDDIVVQARRHNPADPLETVNAASYAAIQAVDKVIVAPVAMSYKKVVPKPIRNGLRNFLDNLQEPFIFVNFLLQLKPGKAAETAGRFAINSTIGAAGLFDMAKRKPFHLPKRINGFAYTMGYYGIKPGPFLFLPIIGPTTVRDVIGRFLDLGFLPAIAGRPFSHPAYPLVSGTVRSVDDRINFDAELKYQRDSGNPYAAAREFYLKTRQAEIDELKGKPSKKPFRANDEQPVPPEEDDDAPAAVPAPAAAAAAPSAQPVPAPATPAINLPVLTPAQ
jgi:phospholipid-binding lipoprotein MlaA